MHARSLLRFALAGLGATVLGAGVASVGYAKTDVASVACGDVITADTTLTSDLNCSGGGLLILADASDVTLDLAGHTISGSGVAAGIGVGWNASQDPGPTVTVENGAVRNFGRGISTFAFGPDRPTMKIVNMAVSGNAGNGIDFIGNSLRQSGFQ